MAEASSDTTFCMVSRALAGRAAPEAGTGDTAATICEVNGSAITNVDHVMQADTGADLDFLVGSSGSVSERTAPAGHHVIFSTSSGV